MKQAFIYSSKIWLTTICAGPYLTGIILVTTDPLIYSVKDIFSVGNVYAVLVGLFAALSSWALFAIIARFSFTKSTSAILIKLYLSASAFILVLLPWAIVESNAVFNSNYWPSLAPWILSYYFITVVGIWLYNTPVNPDLARQSKNQSS